MKWRLIDKTGKHVVSSGKDQQVGIVLLVDKGGEYGVTVELVGAGAKALMLGLVVGRGREWINLSTETVHQVANTHAETMIHGVMFDQATANISGLIKIVKRAQTVTDFLTERILLLSPSAQAIAEPALEIEADEVRASHAATVAPVDENQVFYLTSRGLSQNQAESQMVKGFLGVVVNKIEDDKIRHQVLKRIC
ncbi:TPA: hypothetical protein DEB02_03450 [Candidatus Beckwithbacteria bacterium]|nr:hypothetical protein [Candidatus Beckwithbacteria bacterium]